jgi:hypothetical protein
MQMNSSELDPRIKQPKVIKAGVALASTLAEEKRCNAKGEH